MSTPAHLISLLRLYMPKIKTCHWSTSTLQQKRFVMQERPTTSSALWKFWNTLTSPENSSSASETWSDQVATLSCPPSRGRLSPSSSL